MYRTCSFHNADSRELLDEHGLIHGELLLDCVCSLLSDPPYNIRSGHKDDNSHYGVQTLEGMEDAVDLGKRVMRPGSHAHLFCSALRFGDWCGISRRAREEKDGGSDGGEDIASKKGKGKKKEVLGCRVLRCTTHEKWRTK